MNHLPAVPLRLVAFTCVTILIGVRHVGASMAPPATLNPTTYKSPSGAYALTVDPSDIYGRYGGNYRVTKNGKEIWSATLPFTFWQAAITDTGVAVGYGHTLGHHGFGKDPNEPRPGELIVAIIDPAGKVRLKQATKRQESLAMHALPFPRAHGLIVDEPHDRLIVRLDDDGSDELWWTYRLSSGAVLEKFKPRRAMDDAEPARWILAAQLVRGTPLVLLHWWRWSGGPVGARFTLVDEEAKPVWSLELPGDYMVPHNEEAQDKLQGWIREHGGILRSDQAKRFDLFIAAESKRVTFAVDQKPGGEWTVSEAGRAPFAFAVSEKPKRAAIPRRILQELSPLPLQVNPVSAASAIRNVREFTVDGQGRIAFLREDEGKTSFVLVDATGKLLRALALAIEPKSDVSHWSPLCWVGGSRFVIALSEFAVDGKAKAWRVDAQTGQVEPIPAFDSPSIERLAGASEGSFVALAALRSKYTIEKSVTRYDSRGRRQWQLTDDSRNPDALFDPEDVAVTAEGDVLVLENLAYRLKRFDRNGRHLGTIELEQAWKRKPRYVVGVIPEADGSILISDFNGSPPFVRMTRDGAVAGGFVPKYADGRAIGTAHGMHCSPDGHLWISDGHAVLRLSKAGVVDRVLGERPQTARLGPIAGVVVDPRGLIYAIDSRTGSIYVFDRSGKLLHVCQAKPTDFKGEIMFPALTVNDKGDVYLGLGAEYVFPDDRRSYAHYSAEGRRLDDVVFPAGVCQFQPASGVLVAARYQDVRLIDAEGKVLRTIERRPDGNWLEQPRAVALAPDGSIAILASPTRAGETSVNLYKANGDPIRTIVLPDDVRQYPRIAYDGKRLVVVDRALVIFDGSGTPIARCDSPLKVPEGRWYYPYLLPGGRELALFDGKRPVLHRYLLP
jgi:hypothetical protein